MGTRAHPDSPTAADTDMRVLESLVGPRKLG